MRGNRAERRDLVTTWQRSSRRTLPTSNEPRNAYAKSTFVGRRGIKASVGHAMFESRLRHYDALFEAVGCRPIGSRRFLDLGFADGKWLDLCCRRWGALPENCVGVDLRRHLIECWRQEHPDSKIRLMCNLRHELDFADCSFDLVHHSMMLSSVHIGHCATVSLRPCGDCYDRAATSYRTISGRIHSTARPRAFGARSCTACFLSAAGLPATISLAPPICRLLAKLGTACCWEWRSYAC